MTFIVFYLLFSGKLPDLPWYVWLTACLFELIDWGYVRWTYKKK